MTKIKTEGLTYARQCSECKSGMDEGYCIRDGEAYYCSDKCLHKHFTPKQWKKETENLDDDDNSSVNSYWTQWEMPFEAEYIVKKGKLVEI